MVDEAMKEIYMTKASTYKSQVVDEAMKEIYTTASTNKSQEASKELDAGTYKSQVDMEFLWRIYCPDGVLVVEMSIDMAHKLTSKLYCIPEYKYFVSRTMPRAVLLNFISYCDHQEDKFIKLVDPATLFHVIQAAHYFDTKDLMDLTCQTLVSMVKGKTVEEIRTRFNIHSDDCIYHVQPYKRPRFSRDHIMRSREENALTMLSSFFDVQRSPAVTEALNSIKRRYSEFYAFAASLLTSTSDEDLFRAIGLIESCVWEDIVLADHLQPTHVMILFGILERDTPQNVQDWALKTLSHVSFTAHKYEISPHIIQLLVKFIDHSSWFAAQRALLTLANIAKALPEYVGTILETDALKRVRTYGAWYRGEEMMDFVDMFMAAVCRSKAVYDSNKVGEVLTTLQILFEVLVVSEDQLQQLCYALQYLTYEKVLIIEETQLKKLCSKLIEIIRYPRGDCLYPGYALGVIGNIARWGSSDQIKILTSDFRILEYIRAFVVAKSRKIREEACRIISNIAARMKGGLIEKMHASGLIEPLCDLIEKDESNVKMEAAWAIFNGIYGSFPPPRVIP